MSLDVSLAATVYTTVFSANITHNLAKMATEAGIYTILWRPEEIGINLKARDIIPILEKGIRLMKENPARFEAFNDPNGWGTFANFLPWLQKYLEACREYPEADISVSR